MSKDKKMSKSKKQTCEHLAGQDDTIDVKMKGHQVKADYLFTWFVDLNSLKIPPETIVFAIGTVDLNLKAGNTLFEQHEGAYYLKPEFVEVMNEPGENTDYFNINEIEACLAAGNSIFVDGFQLESLKPFYAATGLTFNKKPKEAFAEYKKSLTIFPEACLTLCGMGDLLSREGDFEKALGFYQKAVPLAPPGIRYEHRAAREAAKCTLALGQYEETLDLVDLILAHTNRDEIFFRTNDAFTHRLAGEAYVLLNQLPLAKQSLEKALQIDEHLGSALWLTGLVCYLEGDEKKAQQYHKKAVARSDVFGPYYDKEKSLAFRNPPKTQVDW